MNTHEQLTDIEATADRLARWLYACHLEGYALMCRGMARTAADVRRQIGEQERRAAAA